MVIREYTTQDIELIIAAEDRFQKQLVEVDTFGQMAWNPGYGEAYVDELIAKTKEQGGTIFIAENDGKMIGFVSGVIEELSGWEKLGSIPLKQGHVMDVFVEEEYRGTGVGKQLMDAMEQYFREKQCDLVYLRVASPNVRAHKLYEELGYVDRDFEMQKKL